MCIYENIWKKKTLLTRTLNKCPNVLDRCSANEQATEVYDSLKNSFSSIDKMLIFSSQSEFAFIVNFSFKYSVQTLIATGNRQLI